MKKEVYLMALTQGLMMTENTIMVSVVALAGVALLHNTSPLSTMPMALQYLSMMIFTFIAGSYATKHGRKPGFIASSLIAIAGSALCYFALLNDSFLLFCLGCFLVGVFNAVSLQFRFAATEIVEGANKAKAVSYVMAGGVIAAFLGPTIAKGSSDISDTLFAGAFLAMAVIYGIIFALLLFYKGAPPQAQSNNATPISYTELLTNPLFLAATVGGAGSFFVMLFMMIPAPLAMQSCGYSFSESSDVLQWHFLLMFAPSFLTGRLMTQYGIYRILMAGIIILIAAVCIGKYDQSYAVYWLGLSLLGLGWNFGYLAASAMLVKNFEIYGNKPKVLFDTIISACVTISVFSSGWIHKQMGWDGVLNTLLPLLVIMLAIVFFKGKAMETKD